MLDVTRLSPKMLDKHVKILAGGVVWSNSLVAGAPTTPPILATNHLLDLC